MKLARGSHGHSCDEERDEPIGLVAGDGKPAGGQGLVQRSLELDGNCELQPDVAASARGQQTASPRSAVADPFGACRSGGDQRRRGCPRSRRTLIGGPPVPSARVASVTGANQVREDTSRCCARPRRAPMSPQARRAARARAAGGRRARDAGRRPRVRSCSKPRQSAAAETWSSSLPLQEDRSGCNARPVTIRPAMLAAARPLVWRVRHRRHERTHAGSYDEKPHSACRVDIRLALHSRDTCITRAAGARGCRIGRRLRQHVDDSGHPRGARLGRTPDLGGQTRPQPALHLEHDGRSCNASLVFRRTRRPEPVGELLARRQQPAAAQHERYDADDHARRLAADEHARPIGRMGGYGGRGARLARGSAGVSATVRPSIVCIERVRDRHGPACPHRPRIKPRRAAPRLTCCAATSA